MNQLRIGIVLNYLNIILHILIVIFYTPYMLRMMGQSEFGLYSLVASIIAYLTLLDFGISNGVIRYTAKLRAEGETTKQYEMFGMFISIYCLLSFVVILVGAFFIIKADDIFSQSMTLDEIYKMKIMLIILIIWMKILTYTNNSTKLKCTRHKEML